MHLSQLNKRKCNVTNTTKKLYCKQNYSSDMNEIINDSPVFSSLQETSWGSDEYFFQSWIAGIIVTLPGLNMHVDPNVYTVFLSQTHTYTSMHNTSMAVVNNLYFTARHTVMHPLISAAAKQTVERWEASLEADKRCWYMREKTVTDANMVRNSTSHLAIHNHFYNFSFYLSIIEKVYVQM